MPPDQKKLAGQKPFQLNGSDLDVFTSTLAKVSGLAEGISAPLLERAQDSWTPTHARLPAAVRLVQGEARQGDRCL